MKILLIQLNETSNLYTPSLANALVKKDYDVNILLAKRVYNPNYYDPNVKIILIDSPSSYRAMLLKTVNPLTFYNILRIIDEVNPDIVHETNEFLWNLILFPLLKRYPLIVTVHEPVFRDAHKKDNVIETTYFRLEFFLRKISRRFGHIDAFITHGKKTKESLIRHNLPSDKIWCMPHGAFSDFTNWNKDSVKEEKAVLFFGIIKRDKGLEYLIESEPLITQLVPDAKIIIAGNGNFKEYISLIRNKEVFEIHNKYIPDEEVTSLFKRANLVVLPYTGGSQSGVIGIAYSFKKPVVVTDVGNIPEQVDDGKTGFIVPPRDSEALAKAIIKLLQDGDLRREMGENAYKKRKNELSWDRIAEKTIEVYKNAITSHKEGII